MTSSDDESKPLVLIVSLLGALDDADIRYCHWKSNEAIDRSLSGENDLDLLIARCDGLRFNAVLYALGFRLARPSSDRQVPGMIDFFGLDEISGRIVHVQAHYQLVLGDDMTKNFRLPFEDAYLESRRFDGLIAVPGPNFELLVFVLRMVVKHCPWDAQLSLKGRLTASERRELEYLVMRSDQSEVEVLRSRYVPDVSADLLARCRAAIEPDSGHVIRAATGRRLLRALEPIGRRSNRSDLRLRVWRRFRRRRQDGRPASRRRIDSGGLLVGMVGGDGSGKSSAVAALGATFSRHFPTYTHHLGKPPRSLLTRLSRWPMRRLPKVGGQSLTSLPAWTDFEALGFPGHAYMIWHLLIARDRYREYRRARRSAAKGAIVICDRFPLADVKSMDCPRGAHLPGLERRPMARWLAAIEARYYRRIVAPDLLVVLRVEPTIAVARRAEQDADFVRRRADEVWRHDWTRQRAVVIDSSQPHDAVLADVHDVVWRAL